MANVKKCDRCGKVFDKNESVRKLQIREVEEHDTYMATYTPKDLCDSCLKSLNSWFKCEPIDIKFDVKPFVGLDLSIEDYLNKCGSKYSR